MIFLVKGLKIVLFSLVFDHCLPALPHIWTMDLHVQVEMICHSIDCNWSCQALLSSLYSKPGRFLYKLAKQDLFIVIIHVHSHFCAVDIVKHLVCKSFSFLNSDIHSSPKKHVPVSKRKLKFVLHHCVGKLDFCVYVYTCSCWRVVQITNYAARFYFCAFF